MRSALRLTLWFLCIGLITITASFTLAAVPSSAAAPASTMMEMPAKNPVTASLISEEESIQPGRPFWVAVHLRLDQEWHAYWKNPGDAGMPPAIDWDLPEGFAAGELVWPAPKRFTQAAAVGFGYENEVVLMAEINPPASQPASEVEIKAEVKWVVCSNSTCLPGESQLALKLPVGSNQPSKAAAHEGTFAKARESAPQKYEGVAVQRKQELLEVAFDEAIKSKVQEAEFFSEHKGAINHSVPALLQQSPDATGQYTVVLKELSAKESLKGILVLRTAEGTQVYQIDTPITSSQGNTQIASITPPRSGDPQVAALQSFEFKGGVPLAIAMAFLGGLILNLMPCVLPVISFKVMSFVKLAGQNRKLIFKHGTVFSAGVLISFWALAALLLVLQAYGRSVGWGFQLQEPLFVAILAAFLFIFGLSLFGLFEMGASMIGIAGEAEQKSRTRHALLGSFFSGVLATAVATPCTGPFLGSAVGFAVTLPAWQAMGIFTSLGLGMASPYLAFSAFPTLLRFMPKPGPWMVTFKELMGFMMMATVVWLIWVFSAQTGPFAVSLMIAGLFLLAFAGWIYGRWTTPLRNRLTRILGMAAAIAVLASGVYTVSLSASTWAQAMGGNPTAAAHNSSEAADGWEQFSPERVVALREQGTPVFIDFTAKWCLICQANHIVLSDEGVVKKFESLGVVRMKADWTKRDEVIAAELRKFGRNSVPLYILYGADPSSEPQVLPQVLTPSAIIEALDKVQETK